MDVFDRTGTSPLDFVIDMELDPDPSDETRVHQAARTDLFLGIEGLFAHRRDILVETQMPICYAEDDPSREVCPDVLVAFGVSRSEREQYLLWKEGKPPTAVFEVTSPEQREEDLEKKRIYARLGILEVFLFDPEGRALSPSIQGFRLLEGRYWRILPERDGSVRSATTGLRLRRDAEDRLRMTDAATGRRLLRFDEVVPQLERIYNRTPAARRRRDQKLFEDFPLGPDLLALLLRKSLPRINPSLLYDDLEL